MDIILHMGAHRCATTTFQQFLEHNAASLGRDGTIAWTPERLRSGMLSVVLVRAQDITPEIDYRARRSAGLVAVEVERARRCGAARLVLSEENMIGAIRNNLRAGALYPDIAVRLARMRMALGAPWTRIALSIRSQDHYWASSLSFGLSHGHRVPDAGMLAALVAQPRRWRDVVTVLTRTAPEADIVVLPFERFASRPEVQLSEITVQSVPANLVARRQWRNMSARRDKLRRILILRGEAQLAGALPPGDGRWMPFDEGQQAELRAQYRADLDWLAGGADGLARLAGGACGTDGLAPARKTEEAHTGTTEAGAWPPARPVIEGQFHGKQNVMV